MGMKEKEESAKGKRKSSTKGSERVVKGKRKGGERVVCGEVSR